MKLSPLEIRKQSFRSTMRGFDREEVQIFLDMVAHESRKYGLARALQQAMAEVTPDGRAWLHVNDVAGFIGWDATFQFDSGAGTPGLTVGGFPLVPAAEAGVRFSGGYYDGSGPEPEGPAAEIGILGSLDVGDCQSSTPVLCLALDADGAVTFRNITSDGADIEFCSNLYGNLTVVGFTADVEGHLYSLGPNANHDSCPVDAAGEGKAGGAGITISGYLDPPGNNCPACRVPFGGSIKRDAAGSLERNALGNLDFQFSALGTEKPHLEFGPGGIVQLDIDGFVIT